VITAAAAAATDPSFMAIEVVPPTRAAAASHRPLRVRENTYPTKII
jgi:hypothetical protein